MLFSFPYFDIANIPDKFISNFDNGAEYDDDLVATVDLTIAATQQGEVAPEE